MECSILVLACMHRFGFSKKGGVMELALDRRLDKSLSLSECDTLRRWVVGEEDLDARHQEC